MLYHFIFFSLFNESQIIRIKAILDDMLLNCINLMYFRDAHIYQILIFRPLIKRKSLWINYSKIR